VDGLRERFGQRLLSVRPFGSYARGDATVESDDGRDFVLAPEALREDLAACEGFLDRARNLVAGAFP
jgi:hypothetical protein